MTPSLPSPPSDADARRRFRVETNRNFSVIAPAGVGKTHALVERIATLAEQQPRALEGLTVITYTKKAANSLRERVWERLQSHNADVRTLLQRSFFGTIHSFCWKLIQTFDPNRYELLTDDTELRDEFLSSLDLGDSDFACFGNLFRFLDVDELLKAVMNADLEQHATEEALSETVSDTGNNGATFNRFPFTSASMFSKSQAVVSAGSSVNSDANPFKVACFSTNGDGCALDVSPIFDFQPQRRVFASIEAAQRSLKEWLSLYQNTQRPLELPKCDQGGEEFKTVFYETFCPFYEHLSSEATECGRLLKERYAAFRRERGYVTYEDCILLARQCLQTDEAKTFYRQRPLSVLLDEAQDTDRAQFDFLQTLIALHPNSHFSMVGDPQQSIYGDRADVRYYLNLHRKFVQSKYGEELIFSETFRCPSGVVSELNARFPRIFRDPNGKQVSYVPLSSALQNDGCVKEITVAYESEEGKIANEEAVALEARELSDFLTAYLQQHPRNLSDICLLSPRNEWLRELKEPLEVFGWKLQLHSEPTTGRDNALFCNALAAIHCINFPQDTFEEAGLLRETFGCSDEALAYIFARAQRRHSSDNENIHSEIPPLPTDALGYPKCGRLRLDGSSSVFERFSNESANDGNKEARRKIPFNPFPGSDEVHFPSENMQYTSEHVDDGVGGAPRPFTLNFSITDAVEVMKNVRHRFRQLLNEISEQSLCVGTVRLIEFFKPLVSSMPTDAYFEDFLLETAFQTQCLGQSWLALEERLRVHLNETAETEEEIQSDALQGFSCHKAKGLEWKTVVMPFFDRPVRYQTPHYPCAYRGKILWNKKDAERSELDDDRRRELQRLLYVACTRTKGDLVLVRDDALWKSEAACPSWGALYDAGST